MNKPSGLSKNIVLVGFMGCGKSTVGRDLFQLLGYPLVDMDSTIERNTGMSIPEIFEKSGENAFRDMETELLQQLAEDTRARKIISTGGGVIMREENRRLLRELGYVVWLDAPVAVIWDRTKRTKNRPLLQTEDPKVRIQTLLDSRLPMYEEVAHLRLDTSGLNSRELATGILESARYYFTSQKS